MGVTVMGFAEHFGQSLIIFDFEECAKPFWFGEDLENSHKVWGKKKILDVSLSIKIHNSGYILLKLCEKKSSWRDSFHKLSWR